MKFYNSRISDDIEMKLGSVARPDKRNKTTSKKIKEDAMSKIYDFIPIFPIYRQFGAIQNPDSGQIVCKTYNFTNSNLLSYKT